MVNQDSFFLGVGLSPFKRGSNIYTDWDCFFLELTETEDAFSISAAMHPNDKFIEVLFFERLFPESDMIRLMQRDLKTFLKKGLSMLETYNHYETFAEYVRFSLARASLSPNEIENLCNVYIHAVTLGNKAQCLSNACKEVILINSMEVQKEIKPELHQLMLHVPDIYYDFINGTENSLAKNPKLQDSCIQYMKRHPDASSIDVIILVSMLNAQPNLTDSYIHRIISLSHQETDFTPHLKAPKKNEIVLTKDNHDWYIFSKVIGKTGFTFRQYNAICLVDYKDVCVCGCLLMWNNFKKEEALVWNIVQSPSCSKEIEDSLNSHMEELALKAGAKSVVICRIQSGLSELI